jgi:MFS family permease
MMTNKTKHTFRAFKNRNYALFFCGQSVSQIGTWMQRTAVSWVVYSMTHSALMLGLAVFAQQFPSFLLSLFGGIVSDRYSRYKILLITQTAAMIQAVLLAALIFTGHYSVWEILFLSIILGVINGFDMPARQPMVHEMVNDKADLPNALALNSAMVNLAFILGPALSGIVLQKFGAGICFLSNAVSFMAVIASLLLMKLPPFNPPAIKKKVISELAEGFNYLKHTPAIGGIILILALSGLLVLPFGTLLPIFAKDIFKGNAATFGYINSFMGLGAICGTFFLASLKKGTDLKIILLFSSISLGLGLALFSHISYFPVAMLFVVVAGFGSMSQNTICITIIQVESDATMRGKMMSYVGLAYFGMLPLGSLLIGTVSQKIGAANAMLCQGIAALIIVIVFFKFLKKDKMNEGHIEQLIKAEEVVTENV